MKNRERVLLLLLLQTAMLSDTLLHTFGYTEIFTFVEIELFIFYPTVYACQGLWAS